MELKNKINLDLPLQCINSYEWPRELLAHTNSLKSLENKFDFEELLMVTKSFKNSLPVIVTMLSREYIDVGRLWLSMIKRTAFVQYIIFATDEETEAFLDSINERCCRI